MAAQPPAAASMSATGAMGATLKAKGGESVRVVVRVRPLSKKEEADGREKIVQMDVQRGVAMLMKPGGADRDVKDFTYDAVFDPRHTQQQIFDDTALEIVDSVMDGFNGTIFAYGQTGAGKSHTMTGPDPVSDQRGLLPRSFSHIFENLDKASKDTQYLVRGSYLEIYNEEIRDLLSTDPKAKCELKDSPNSGVYVKDLSTKVVKSVEEMDQVLATGLKNRSVAATNMNEGSSRSHSIFMVTVEQCSTGVDGEPHIRVGKLNMVDLAGSERQSKTGATGDRLKEATKINLSLSALGNVISALVDGKSSHIPYRDSKLTRLLQDSLGGNTKTVMVANCGPADYNYDETLSTLRYAYRAKSIKNKPRINEDPKDAMIREFQDEIMRLKAELEAGGGVGEDGLPLPGGRGKRVEKKIEYVEKIVERTVEREVVVEQGPSPEEVQKMEEELRRKNEEARQKAEQRRAELAVQRDLAEEERKNMLEEIDREEKAAMAEQKHRADMQAKLKEMQDKMMAGKTVMEKAIQQEAELKKQQKRLKKQQDKEEQLKQREEDQRLENLDLQEKCNSQEEQVSKLSGKLQKLWDKYQKAQQEMVDLQQFNQGEREEMLNTIRDLRQTLKLKTLIMESFVPPKDAESTRERAVWDPEVQEWQMRQAQIDKDNRLVRPSSALGLPRPTSEFARINQAMGDPNPRYMYDSIVITDLDLPERTTEDYEVHPELGDKIEQALLLALSPDDDGSSKHQSGDPGDPSQQRAGERPSTGQRKRPPSGRPGTGRRNDQANPPQQAFPVARGLVSRE